MQILGTDAYRTALSEAFSRSIDSVSLASAYLTTEGIEWVLERLASNVKCRVLTRWDCSDLVFGASDIEVYEKLASRGYRLYMLLDLHAKVIEIDKRQLFLGSANITNSGLKLVPGGNREIGTILSPTEQDLILIDTMFSEAVLVDQGIYQSLLAELLSFKNTIKEPQKRPRWSQSLLDKVKKPPQRIWVAETIWCNSPEALLANPKSVAVEVEHDLALLGLDAKLNKPITKERLRESFMESRIWRWLKHQLQTAPDREMYYGPLSVQLHDSFLDDPRPYRKNVKPLLTNLLNWAANLCGDWVVIDQPRHSQRIRILK